MPTEIALAAINTKVAHANAMVHPAAPETQAVRAAFFIDRKRVLRAMVYCPLSNSRSKYRAIVEWHVSEVEEAVSDRLVLSAIRQALDDVEKTLPGPRPP